MSIASRTSAEMNAELRVVNDKQDTGLEVTDAFSDFWLLYPRRVAKKDAKKAWARLTESQQMAAIVAVVEWRRVWAKRDIEYVMHPATFLNGERWEDELPASDHVAASASHITAKMPEPGERLRMPDHVRALIAKLRK